MRRKSSPYLYCSRKPCRFRRLRQRSYRNSWCRCTAFSRRLDSLSPDSRLPGVRDMFRPRTPEGHNDRLQHLSNHNERNTMVTLKHKHKWRLWRTNNILRSARDKWPTVFMNCTSEEFVSLLVGVNQNYCTRSRVAALECFKIFRNEGFNHKTKRRQSCTVHVHLKKC